jgi:hypothetical protein
VRQFISVLVLVIPVGFVGDGVKGNAFTPGVIDICKKHGLRHVADIIFFGTDSFGEHAESVKSCLLKMGIPESLIESKQIDYWKRGNPNDNRLRVGPTKMGQFVAINGGRPNKKSCPNLPSSALPNHLPEFTAQQFATLKVLLTSHAESTINQLLEPIGFVGLSSDIPRLPEDVLKDCRENGTSFVGDLFTRPLAKRKDVFGILVQLGLDPFRVPKGWPVVGTCDFSDRIAMIVASFRTGFGYELLAEAARPPLVSAGPQTKLTSGAKTTLSVAAFG